MTFLPFEPQAIVTHGWMHGWKEDIEFYYRCILALDDMYMDKYMEKEKARAEARKNEQKNKSHRH